jgi:Na+/H+ antiporter NhaD/arsenite permease-like protein
MNDSMISSTEIHKENSYPERAYLINKRMLLGLVTVLIGFLLIWGIGLLPHHTTAHSEGALHEASVEELQPPRNDSSPPFWAAIPFILLLLSIAVLPLLRSTQEWWHSNRNRFLVAATLGITTLVYYAWIHPGGLANHFTHDESSEAGLPTLWTAFSNGILVEFIPFIVLLFSLYVISGGIHLQGDLPAHPATNTSFLAVGTLLASFIGTTGAAMVLIRPLIVTNVERRYKTHTIVFFIFTVCNCGGLLLPVGDPPLFLGYLRGVPFTWTVSLWPYWLAVNTILLSIYFLWDSFVYHRKESLRDLIRDESQVRPLKLYGSPNIIALLGIVFCVAAIVPDKPFLGSTFTPPQFFREAVMLLIIACSLKWTDIKIRIRNRFDYIAITEVAALFSGIFITMQVPIEILSKKGSSLNIDTAFEFFWATGILSSFLDNAPTYVVFFEAATTLPSPVGAAIVSLSETRSILETFLIPISLGAVFMGANTYIGNGPNFMVKSIAEQAGIRMPSFFGYMGYSLIILGPILIVVSFFL